MINFEKLPMATLDVATGKTTGLEKPQEAPNIGIDTKDFHNQVIKLAQNKVPKGKVNAAIDTHEGITDKETAKRMAEAVYSIMGK